MPDLTSLYLTKSSELGTIFFSSSQTYSKMYRTEPRFNEILEQNPEAQS